MDILYEIKLKGKFPLFKIQSSEIIDSFMGGCFYMNSLKYYRDKYNKTLDETIGDPYEGKLVIHNGVIRVPEKNIIQSLNNFPLSTKNEDDYVQCMFGINPLLHNKFILSDEQKEKLKGFGDFVLVITDTYEFFNRIETAAKRDG